MGASASASTQPSSDEWNTMVIAYAASTLALFVKYMMSLIYASNTGHHPSEDKDYQLPPPPEDIVRRERQFSNDLENIPMHLIVFWAAFIIQILVNASGNGGRNGTLALTVLVITYAASRCLFTICYVFSAQPWRTICWVISTLSVITAACFLMYSAVELDITAVFPDYIASA